VTEPKNKTRHFVVAVGDLDDQPAVQAAYHLADANTHVHLLHVLSPRSLPGGAEPDLALLDEEIRERRRWLRSLHRAVMGEKEPSFAVGIRVEIGRIEETLLESADTLAADLLFVGGTTRDLDESWEATLAERVTRRAPCSVVVLREKTSRDEPKLLLDPPPAPGERERETNAKSDTHVYVPNRDRVVDERRAELDGTFGRPM